MFDRTPTEDQFRATSFADANRYWLAAGASYALSSTTSIDLAIVHVLEDATNVNITRTFFDATPLASAVNIRSAVQSSVTTVAAGLTLRF
jgi:long-subunit fatty acid transport protein